MVLPLMPQGVEHDYLEEFARYRWNMVLPLMPQGVEHKIVTFFCACLSGMVLPLMPQGVEHVESVAKLGEAVADGPSVDAARR